MVLLRIAFRNLIEHKTKTLIIGSLVALGIMILVVGNSFMATINEGMKKSYSENYTGNLILRQNSDEDISLIGGGMNSSVPTIDEYKDITATLDREGIKYTSVLSGFAAVSVNESMAGFSLLWGVDPKDYFRFFPDSVILLEGRFIEAGEDEILISQNVLEDLEKAMKEELSLGDHIQLSVTSENSGTKIREVEIVGIFQFTNPGGQIEMISYINQSTFRSLSGLSAYSQEEVKLSSSEAALLGEISESDLFGDALFSSDLFNNIQTEEFNQNIDNILGDTSLREKYRETDNSAWHFILIDSEERSTPKLKWEVERILNVPPNSGRSERLSKKATSIEKPNDSSLILEDWKWGAGMVARMASGLQVIFNVIVLIIAIVAVIIIMNTLVISVTERIPEIGTIRAIGGQKRFIRWMITFETLMITLFFGALGILLGSGIIGIFNLVGISTSNDFLMMLFGGPNFYPVLAISSVFSSLIIVTFIGLVASMYPVAVALEIQPVKAMQR